MSERWKTVWTTISVILAIALAVFFIWGNWWVNNREACADFTGGDKVPARCVEIKKQ